MLRAILKVKQVKKKYHNNTTDVAIVHLLLTFSTFNNVFCLNHFIPLISLYAPLKHQKICFRTFSSDIERGQWHKTGLSKVQKLRKNWFALTELNELRFSFFPGSLSWKLAIHRAIGEG